MQNTDDNRNMIMFLIASMVLLFAYQFLYIGPQQQKEAAKRAAAAASAQSVVPQTATPTNLSREAALKASPRVLIDTPSIKGSIALVGGRIDDVSLVKYDAELGGKTGKVALFQPVGTASAYYAESGFMGQNIPNLPNANTIWALKSGTTLGVGKPIVLTYNNGAGLVFDRTIAVDENYLISVSDTVANTTAAPVALSSYAQVVRLGLPPKHQDNIVHEGPIANWSKLKNGSVSDGYIASYIKYKDMIKKGRQEQDSKGGWLGITDTYWLTALIPDQSKTVAASLLSTSQDGKPKFQAGFIGPVTEIKSGQAIRFDHKLFAGAKRNEMLEAYSQSTGAPRLEAAIDWGMFAFLTRPMHWLLDFFNAYFKNFGWAILALTVVVKLVFYPLAQSAQKSMLQMKKVQEHLAPKLEAIKARHPNDPQKQQMETMELYQREKINPMAGLQGCLPMFLQLPVFFALYKVLLISIDMRHAPFIGFVKDLSAPDPTSIINLFGLLPFDPAAVPLIGGILAGPLHIGVVAILYGLTMWLSQRMTPMTAIDPMQKAMFEFMPLIFTFIMAQFAVGLLIYWVWSNILTTLQTYAITRTLKMDNVIDQTIAKLMARFKGQAST